MIRAIVRYIYELIDRNKYIFFILVALICVMSLSLGIYIQFFYKYSDIDPLMIGINIGAKKTAEEYAFLESNFDGLFNNKLQGNEEEARVEKLENSKELVYTAYHLVNEDETYYNVNAQIPILNIDSEVAKKVNTQIRDEYYNQANSIMRQTQGNTVYTVTYASYINSDILSMVIKSSLKEQGKSEKVTIKTYTYSLKRENLVSLQELIGMKKTTPEIVQKTIHDEVKKAYENAKIIASEYGNLYERDLKSERYDIKNANVYFLTDDGHVYIVYPYGNEDYTNERDIVIF